MVYITTLTSPYTLKSLRLRLTERQKSDNSAELLMPARKYAKPLRKLALVVRFVKPKHRILSRSLLYYISTQRCSIC